MNTVFEKIEDGNLIYKIRKKTHSSLLLRSLFFAFPWIASAILCGIMYFESLEEPLKEGLSFWHDYSNSLGCVTLFIVVYYKCGRYPELLRDAFCDEIIKSELNDNVFREFVKKANVIGKKFIWLHKLSWIMAVMSPVFFMVAATQNGKEYWFNMSSPGVKLYYCIFLLMVWYMSAKLLFEAVLGCVLSYELVKNDVLMNFEIDALDGVFGIKKFVELSVMNVSGGIYYFGVVFAIIITDQLSADIYDVYNAFYTIKWLGIVVLAICIIMIIIFLIPLIDTGYSLAVKKRSYFENNKINLSLEEKIRIGKMDTSAFKLSYSKLPMILATVIPVFDIVIRLVLSK